MKAAEIRDKFLQYFASQGHSIVPSSSLVPHNDPTLLFTNSGMVQFKDVFLGQENRPETRATTAQRCVRAGGKHNDLENVGYTARHHTFFEMLGNFSFGDYFKRDAIRFAWDLLTKVYGLPPDKLWVTVYQDDDDAYDLWATMIGVPAERIVRIGDNKGARYASDNFWQMADTGPCGPCSEIFYDHGEAVWGGPPGSPEADGDRYIEIWNLVFMQFNRASDGSMTPLPRPCVDTGMGLERIAAVLQHVHSNYEIDLFQHLIKAAQQAIAQQTDAPALSEASLKVIADHGRACTFLMTDGVMPSNEGRGYVLRRIVRRAIRHGYKLGCRLPFFHQLVAAVVAEMGAAYPELLAAQANITAQLLQEETRFFETIEHGMGLLETALAEKPAVLPGELAFKLHDTFGFPLDLTADVCRERGITVDEVGFDQAMAKQREQARAAGKFKAGDNLSYQGETTIFQGYEHYRSPQATIIALYRDGQAIEQAGNGDRVVVVLDQTPFYAESGGQVGDQGQLSSANAVIHVQDTLPLQRGVIGHHGIVQHGSVKLGDQVDAQVNEERRAAIMRHHSATHLLHKALRDILGPHVQQKGSLVDDHKTRFDFSHPNPLSEEELQAIEQQVNSEILSNQASSAQTMALDDARKEGAMMLFGEKYADTVRVLAIGNSKELCGGTHVRATGDIGLFKITAQSAVAAGVRRLEAVCGQEALAYVQTIEQQQHMLAQRLKTPPQELPQKIQQLLDEQRLLHKQLEQLQTQWAGQQLSLCLQAKQIMGKTSLVITAVNGVPSKQLRDLSDQVRDALLKETTHVFVVLATVQDDKVNVVANVSSALTQHIKAGDLVAAIAPCLGGKGGGRADFAQAGGSQTDALPQALTLAGEWLRERLRDHQA